MPVDLSPAGRPSAYPRRPRFWPWWCCFWLACDVIGAAIVLLLWPKAEPASGAWFWFWVVGVPNGVSMLLFGIERAGYEGLWFRAHFRNQHRSRWLAKRLGIAQKPLQVLGVGYCLPLGGQSLSSVIEAEARLPVSQVPRTGPGLIEHARFDESGWLVDDPTGVDLPDDSEPSPDVEKAIEQVSLLTLKMAEALKPLADSLRVLTRYESSWWPQVRVLAPSGKEQAYVAHVSDALRRAGLPSLAVQAASASDGLMVADAWLDANERRPLLVVATAWHEAGPPEKSTEGCVAILLAPGFFRLPASITVGARLHRPVAGIGSEMKYGLANAALWGKADPASIARTWITRPVDGCNKALRAAHMAALTKDAAQRRADLVVGDMGDANGWLSVAAAIEPGEKGDSPLSPQLIVDGVQSAILRLTPVTPVRTVTTQNHQVSDDRSQAHPAIA